MAPSPKQARIVASLKAAPPFAMSIPISSYGPVQGFLTPITHDLAEKPDVVDALYRWRKAHMAAFLTVFAPTREKTYDYLNAFSLPDPARILFLIVDPQKSYVGHIGLCNIAPDGAEIDNVIRGEHIDVPHFMVSAHRALLGWAFAGLDLPLVYLNVLADNARAIRTYESVGLRPIARSPLLREEFDGGYRLRPAPDQVAGEGAPSLLRMEMSRESLPAEQSR